VAVIVTIRPFWVHQVDFALVVERLPGT